jgi:phosphoribosylaminoimidazole-succinocarboxamide synthase
MLNHDTIVQAIPHALTSVDLPNLGEKQTGKVRDIYTLNGSRLLITTDRVSAFDRVVGAIPFKGQVLKRAILWATT